MIRQNVYAEVEGQWPGEPELVLAGWYDWNKATHYRAETYATGRWEELHRTAQGRWVLLNRTQWQGERDAARFLADDKAREWLLRHDEDEAVEQWFGEIEEERGPGRPEIGPAVNIRFSAQLLGRIDTQAAREKLSRSEMIRRLTDRCLANTGR